MSAAASSSSGRIPQGEVIMDVRIATRRQLSTNPFEQFADGGSYIKHKLENAVLALERRRITKEEGLKAQRAMEALEVGKSDTGVKSEDVGFIVQQLGCGSGQAEEALIAEKGDLVKALIRLARPRPRARSVDDAALPLK
ncbi:MAG: hypothetical protein TREMPRED_002804 [Tremellales sp. Tagirdzhanova-0007]|nr:MAG: hypothetical protein TREMPRED_002804 [Tremellales sp. Tagirdzhanova-0007]